MHSSQGRFSQQMNLLRRQFAQSAELPFSDVLSPEVVELVLTEAGVTWKECTYTPLTTLLVFTWQAISQDQSCQGAVTKLANRLQRRLMAQQNRSWDFDQEEGMLDAARLARVIVNPAHSLSYKIERETDFRDTVVTLAEWVMTCRNSGRATATLLARRTSVPCSVVTSGRCDSPPSHVPTSPPGNHQWACTTSAFHDRAARARH